MLKDDVESLGLSQKDAQNKMEKEN